jgi:hypothetical protein
LNHFYHKDNNFLQCHAISNKNLHSHKFPKNKSKNKLKTETQKIKDQLNLKI